MKKNIKLFIILVLGVLFLIVLIFSIKEVLNPGIPTEVGISKEKIIVSQPEIIIHTPEEEKKAIAIDEYNFEQLEKAKLILEKLPKNNEVFFHLSKFNEKYNANIKPIKNCYYISNSNGIEKYIFGFQLESNKYIEINGSKDYAYPKYNLPITTMCIGYCYDDNMKWFKKTISNPCVD